jgi:hypothetical protein
LNYFGIPSAASSQNCVTLASRRRSTSPYATKSYGEVLGFGTQSDGEFVKQSLAPQSLVPQEVAQIMAIRYKHLLTKINVCGMLADEKG